MVTSISIPVFGPETAKKVASYLNGKTYMNLVATWGSYPCAGNENVTVSTARYETSVEELKDMVLSLLADEVGRLSA